MRACPSQRAYEVCLCSVPGVVTADQGYNLPIYILLSVVTLDARRVHLVVTCHTDPSQRDACRTHPRPAKRRFGRTRPGFVPVYAVEPWVWNSPPWMRK